MPLKEHGPGGCCCGKSENCFAFSSDFTEEGGLGETSSGIYTKGPFTDYNPGWDQSNGVLLPDPTTGAGGVRGRVRNWTNTTERNYFQPEFGSQTTTYWVEAFDEKSIFHITGANTASGGYNHPCIGITTSGVQLFDWNVTTEPTFGPWGQTAYKPSWFDTAGSKDVAVDVGETWCLPGERVEGGLGSGITKIELRTGWSTSIPKGSPWGYGVDDGSLTLGIGRTSCLQVWINDELKWNSVGTGIEVPEPFQDNYLVRGSYGQYSAVYTRLGAYSHLLATHCNGQMIWKLAPKLVFPGPTLKAVPESQMYVPTFCKIHEVEWKISDWQNKGVNSNVGEAYYCGQTPYGGSGCAYNFASPAPYHQGAYLVDDMDADLDITIQDGDLEYSGIVNLSNATNDNLIYEKIWDFGDGPDVTWTGGPSIFSYKLKYVSVRPMRTIAVDAGLFLGGVCAARDVLELRVVLQRNGSTVDPSGWYYFGDTYAWVKQIYNGQDAGASSYDFRVFKDDGTGGNATVTVNYASN